MVVQVVVYEHYTDGLDIDNIYGSVWKAQTFIPSVAHPVSVVSLRLKVQGTPAGNVIVSIKNTDATGQPTGPDLASGAIPCSEISTLTGEWYDFTLSSVIQVQAGVQYAICLRAPDMVYPSLVWYMMAGTGSYPDGHSWQTYDNGAYWSSLPAYDAVFEILGEGVPPIPPEPVAKPKIVGYLSDWEMANIPDVLNKIQLKQLTHLGFTGVQMRGSGDPTIVSGWTHEDVLTVQATYLAQAVAAGHANGIKIEVSFYGTSTAELETIINTPALLTQLVTNMRDMLVNYNLDGIDIDWESGQPVADTDKLITAIYAVLHPLGKTISIADSSARQSISLPVMDMLDWVAVMCYDMGAPVHSSFADSVAGMTRWADAGYPKSKVLMGIPFYGYDSDYTAVLYGEIVDALNPTPDQNQASINSISTPRGVIPITGGVLWWSGIDLARQKADWAIANGFGGVMCFAVGEDKLQDPRSLLQAIYEEMAPQAPVQAGMGWIAVPIILGIILAAVISKRRHQ